MKNKNGNIAVIIIIIVVVAVTAGVIGWQFAKKTQPLNNQKENIQVEAPQIADIKTQTKSDGDLTVEKPAFDKTELEKALKEAVNRRIKSKWDDKVTIDAVHDSLKAAKGNWWATDAWPWIAWKLDDGNWKVLLSVDGFYCKELTSVPSQYDSFFHNSIYMELKKGGEQKQCY